MPVPGLRGLASNPSPSPWAGPWSSRSLRTSPVNGETAFVQLLRGFTRKMHEDSGLQSAS